MSSDPWEAVGAGGLGLPAPPAALVPQLEQLGEAEWGTRQRAPALTGLGWFAGEFEEGRARDYVLAGADTKGGQLALHYLVVVGRVGLFAQAELPLAPHRGDRAGRTLLDLVGELQGVLLGDERPGWLDEPGRFLCVDTMLSGSWWRWTADPEAAGLDGVTGALEYVRHRGC